MYSLVLIAFILMLAFSIFMTSDVHHKLGYTQIRDHRKMLRWAMWCQGIILLYLIGVLIYRHIHFINIGW
ncbi:hypothetical protein D3C80_2082600 [compost metagenome]